MILINILRAVGALGLGIVLGIGLDLSLSLVPIASFSLYFLTFE